MKMTRLFFFVFSPSLTLLKNNSKISLLMPYRRELMEVTIPVHFEDSYMPLSSFLFMFLA